jgi:hypothetical protein
MNPIAVKHRDGWPGNQETCILDHKKVKLIVFHGTMFFDDDVDVYGLMTSNGAEYWLCSQFLKGGDHKVLLTG